MMPALPERAKKRRIERIRELYRRGAYRLECKHGKAPTYVRHATNTADLLSSLSGMSAEEAKDASRSIVDASDPIFELSRLLRGANEGVLNYLLSKTSYRYFTKKYFPESVSIAFAPRFHDPYFDVLQAVETHRVSTPAVIAGPRSFGKSTLGGSIMPVHAIVFPVYIEYSDGRIEDISKRYIVFFAQKRENAQPHLRFVCQAFENNEDLRRDFGEFYRDPGRRKVGIKDLEWSRIAATTLNGKRLEVHSRKGKVRGIIYNTMRPDLFIGDDLDDDENSKSKQKREEDYRWMTRTAINLLDEERGNVLLLGNYVNPGGVFARMLDHAEECGWLCKKFKTYEIDPDTGEKIWTWPERFNEKWEQQKIEIIGEEAHAAEYQQDPEAYNRDIRSEDFQFYNFNDLLAKINECVCFLAIDPASSVSARADDTAIFGIAHHIKERKAYVLPAFLGKIPIPDQAPRIIQTYLQWTPIKVGIESVAYQAALKERVDEEAIRLGIHIETEGLTHYYEGAKKPRIATRLFQGIREGSIVFLEHDQPQIICRDQLLNLRSTDKDDAADCLEMAVRLRDNWILSSVQKRGFVRARVVASRVSLGGEKN